MKRWPILLIIFLSACTKENVTPTTPGPVGPAGANGTMIYSGTITPDASIGNDGDFYLDLTSHILYGPKTASGWGNGFSMVGPAGANGTNGTNGSNGATGATGATGAKGATGAPGSQIYAGTGAPSSSLGAIGDYYLQKDSAYLYGPKLSSGWGTPITLQGNANVEYTPWFGVGNQTVDTVWGTVHIFFDQPVPAISDDIFNQGMVITFAQLNGYYTDLYASGQVQQMPISLTYSNMTDTWSAIVTPGNVRIDFVNSVNYYTVGVSDAHLFRCVIVPGGVSIPAGLKGSELMRYLRVPTE